MKAIAVGSLAAFAYSYGLWAMAREYSLNTDPVEAGVIKSLAYTFIIAFPISVVAQLLVKSRRWKILWMIPISFGIALLVATLLAIFQSPAGQLLNILAFLGMPVAFSIPYALIVNRRAEQDVHGNTH
jgi:uncharacterized membrane protein